MNPFMERTDQVLALMERVAGARKKLGKRPGEAMSFKANCPACGAENSVVIHSDGKRMLRILCATPDCLRAIG